MPGLGLALRIREYGGTGGSKTNVCLDTVGLSGTVIGYHTGLGIGSSKLTETADGTLFYGFYWDYPAVKGDFYIKWGTDGKVKLDDIDQIFIEGPDNGIGIAQWNQSELAYVATDLVAAEKLKIAYDAGELEPFCFSMLVLPTEFIRISYTTMLIGA